MILIVALFVCMISAAIAASAADKQKSRNRAQKALRAGDLELAEKIFRELVARNERDTDARLGLSHALLKERRFQDSFDQAASALAIDPSLARAHALLGSVLLGTGDFPLSVDEFHKALALKSDDAMAIGGLAMVDFYENRVTNCLAGLRRASGIDPDEPDYVFNLGQAAARSEHYKEAADAYERFLLVAPRTDADRRARIRGLIDFLRYLGEQGSLYEIGGADRTVLQLEAGDYRPIIRVRVNGSKETLRFVLDTGSGMSVVSEETARKLGVRSVAHGGLARAVGGGGRFEIVYGYLTSLDLGDIRIGNVPVYIRHFYDETNPVDGYLGIAALSRLVTAVDYGSHRLTLVRHRNTPATGLSAITSTLDKPESSPAIEARPGIDLALRSTSSGFLSGEVFIEGVKKPLNFIIDTGATVTVLAQKVAELEELRTFIQESHMRVFGAAGIAEDVKTALLPKLAIGTYTRERIDAAVLDLEPVNETAGFQQGGILGGNFLRHFCVVFDFQKGIVRLEPLEKISVQNENGPRPDDAQP